jgi:uroporphyrin-III C-methyltransferase
MPTRLSYDGLIDPCILQLAEGAMLDHAGKRGDPCVFGRRSEEALSLAEADITFRIVPGITAGIAGLAYPGIPVIHRDTNSAGTLLTGHGSDGAIPGGLDWRAIAHCAPVLVLHMASRHLPRIVERLISAAPHRPEEPVAVIGRATTAAPRARFNSLFTRFNSQFNPI